MLVVEQLISPHSHSHTHHDDLPLHSVKGELHQEPSELEFDAELDNLEREEGLGHPGHLQATSNTIKDTSAAATSRAFPLTFGLVIHGLTDGLALGVSSLAKDASGEASKLSLIVFLALIIHKGESQEPRAVVAMHIGL